MTISKPFFIAALAFAALCSPRTTDAQLGGLIKKKVGEAVKGPEKSPETKPEGSQGATPFGSDVLEITQPVLDGFVRGLTLEVKLRKEFRDELSKYPTQAQYDACEGQVAVSEEGQKVAMQMTKLPENASVAETQRVMEQMSKDMAALVKKRCPFNPADWPDNKRGERLSEIRVKAAAAAAPVGGPGPREEDVLEDDTAERASFLFPVSSQAATGLTVRQYEILLERIERFCAFSQQGAPSAVQAVGDTNQVKFPGTGQKIFWVFTAVEVRTLNRANCKSLMTLAGQLI